MTPLILDHRKASCDAFLEIDRDARGPQNATLLPIRHASAMHDVPQRVGIRLRHPGMGGQRDE